MYINCYQIYILLRYYFVKSNQPEIHEKTSHGGNLVLVDTKVGQLSPFSQLEGQDRYYSLTT